MVKLEDYTIGELKKMISSFNKIVKFAGYSTKKKVELIKRVGLKCSCYLGCTQNIFLPKFDQNLRVNQNF